MQEEFKWWRNRTRGRPTKTAVQTCHRRGMQEKSDAQKLFQPREICSTLGQSFTLKVLYQPGAHNTVARQGRHRV